MRDGKQLFARVFGAAGETTIVLVHGFGANSSFYQPAASAWAEASGARVVALDLRGHGSSDGKPGRLDRYGQYGTDLADVIGALRKEGMTKIILAGHSMGGGVVLTYALKPETPPDAYLLIAPLLGNNAPTAPASGGAAPTAGNLYVRTPRIVGEVMFSLIRVHAFDDLPILYLSQNPPMTYGLTAVISMAPPDYGAAFRAIDVPLLLVAGKEDEVFRASGYPGVVQQYSSGRSVLVDGATHVSVLTAPAALAEIKSFIATVEGP
jgi:pimeloyl-ACP methyl ester carboxylesterase